MHTTESTPFDRAIRAGHGGRTPAVPRVALELAGMLDLHIGDCARLVHELGTDHARELAFRALMES